MSQLVARFPSSSEFPAFALALDCAGSFWRTSQSRWFTMLPKWVQSRLIDRHIRAWLKQWAPADTAYHGLIGSLAEHRIQSYFRN